MFTPPGTPVGAVNLTANTSGYVSASPQSQASPGEGRGRSNSQVKVLPPKTRILEETSIFIEVHKNDAANHQVKTICLEMGRQVAKVSPVLEAVICATYPNEPKIPNRPKPLFGPSPAEQELGPAIGSQAPPLPEGRFDKTEKGDIFVIKLTECTSCTEETLLWIINWLDYHVNDAAFEEATRIDVFDEDDERNEAIDRITDLPCFFDWLLITNVACGGPEFSKNDSDDIIDPLDFGVPFMSDFLHLMVAANYLKLEGLLLLGGKFLKPLISGKSPETVRNLLGIQQDMSLNDVQNILAFNEPLLSPFTKIPANPPVGPSILQRIGRA